MPNAFRQTLFRRYLFVKHGNQGALPVGSTSGRAGTIQAAASARRARQSDHGTPIVRMVIRPRKGSRPKYIGTVTAIRRTTGRKTIRSGVESAMPAQRNQKPQTSKASAASRA